MILSDQEIEREITIKPFVKEQVSKGTISYGVSSYGYDVRAGYKFKIFTPVHCAIVDPKNFDEKCFVDVDVTPGHLFEKQSWMRSDGATGDFFRCNRCDYHYGFCCSDDEESRKCQEQPDHILIPPNSFALAETIEYFEMPRNIMAIVVGKSTYARCGLVVAGTPIEPEFRGKITLEISNTTPLPARVFANEGLCQILFFRAGEVCKTSYADRKGKYQDQTGLTLPRMK